MTVFLVLIAVALEVALFRILYGWSYEEREWAWLYFALTNAIVADLCLLVFAVWQLAS